MKRKRMLRTTAAVLLLLMLATGAQAATAVFDKTALMRGRETGMFLFGFIKGVPCRKALPVFKFLAPFEVPDLAILRGKEIVVNPVLTSGMFKFQAVPGIFPANALDIVGGDSDLGPSRLLDFNLSRTKVSDEPMPAAAVLILVGLIALIALRGRRK